MRKYNRSAKDIVSFLLGLVSVIIIIFFVVRYILQNVSFAP